MFYTLTVNILYIQFKHAFKNEQIFHTLQMVFRGCQRRGHRQF